ncbi:hypothetical protein [Commensalibacter communis]|uniref:hypothetical protein n=1 Tax=Commensalibacter communis TaxID=2972786 RepID=UPI00233129B2|nr:hypothetical protein [Commensalibacter communis]
MTALYDDKIYGKEYCCYQVNHGLLTINTWLNGIIFNITCDQNIKGSYKDKIYTGISVGELLSLSTHQMIVDDDYLYVDHDFGLRLLMPTGCDDIQQLPINLVFKQTCVHEPHIFE